MLLARVASEVGTAMAPESNNYTAAHTFCLIPDSEKTPRRGFALSNVARAFETASAVPWYRTDTAIDIDSVVLRACCISLLGLCLFVAREQKTRKNASRQPRL
jgi:hypothetical protein